MYKVEISNNTGKVAFDVEDLSDVLAIILRTESSSKTSLEYKISKGELNDFRPLNIKKA